MFVGVGPLILCQEEVSGHASLASQWQSVIRAAKILETLFFVIYPSAQRTADSQPQAQQFKTLLYIQSHSAQVKPAPAETAYFDPCDSLTQSEARWAVPFRPSVVSTLY